jgi:hypothetical protein
MMQRREPTVQRAVAVALMAVSSLGSAQEQPETVQDSQRERPLLALSGYGGPRFPRCQPDCGDVGPGVGFGATVEVRFVDHAALGLAVERALYGDSIAITLLGAYARGYPLARGRIDPFLELAFLGAKPDLDCSGASGGVGWRARMGIEVFVLPNAKLGGGASHMRLYGQHGCPRLGFVSPASQSDLQPMVAGAFALDGVVTITGL